MIPVGIVRCITTDVPPKGWLICDGSTFSKNKYPKLYNLLNNDVLPDMREASPTCIAGSGDVYTLGQFKDDVMQAHAHYGTSAQSIVREERGGSGFSYPPSQSTTTVYSSWPVMSGGGTFTTTAAGVGVLTRGKRIGVNFIIKAV